MDVNNTTFHLFMGKTDWEPVTEPSDESNLCWDGEYNSLGLKPFLFRFQTHPSDRPLGPEDRRGAAADQFGNWYWIAESGTTLRFRAKDAIEAEHFWSAEDIVTGCETENHEGLFKPCVPPAPTEPFKLRGLTVTEYHYLVVGLLNPPGLLIFDLHAGGPPIQMLWPIQVPFAPFDMAPAPGGGVWILDLSDIPRYWALDDHFRVIAVEQDEVTIEEPKDFDFHAISGEGESRGRRVFPAGIDVGLSSPIGTRFPVAIEALPDGSVLILESDPDLSYSTIYRYRFGRLLNLFSLEKVLEEFMDVPSPDAPAISSDVKGHDIAFVSSLNESGYVTGTLYIADIDGNQTFAFALKAIEEDLDLQLLGKYFPMRRFSGKSLVSDGENVYYDYQERWFPLIEHKRPRYREEGTGTTPVLDGKEPDCVWHRILLDACIPPGAKVHIESRAGNSGELLEREPWQDEPEPYLRSGGAELPYYRPYSVEMEKLDGVGTWELLLQGARGRYLQLRLTLQGTGQNTPWMKALRVYYPRFSYLNEYLPALYRDDEISASFLDRFLANAEGLFTALEGRIAQVQFLFGVRTIPEEYLEWLSGWLGVQLDATWDYYRQQLFVDHAQELFNQRGTLQGLIRAIRLATDPYPDGAIFEEDVTAYCGGFTSQGESMPARNSVRIVEKFLVRRAPGVVFGDPTETEGPGVTTDISTWTPEQGAGPLHQRYRDYLEEHYLTAEALGLAWGKEIVSFSEINLTPTLPVNETEANDWRRFLQVGLGFTYSTVDASDPQDRQAFQDFLGRRYHRVAVLNETYMLTGTAAYKGFYTIPLPSTLPEGGVRLFDWIQFVSIVLPTIRNAHRFTVLVPTVTFGTPSKRGPDPDLVRRIVELEKPAHTDFEIKEYWALFRVGEARLGLDTLLDRGSRLVALILGQGFLSQAHLALSHPWNVPDRVVIGRDRISPDMTL